MRLSTTIPIILALLATPATAQSAAKLRKELKTMERAAKKDPEALFKAGEWAKEKALAKDAERLFKQVLKLDEGHAGANEALGNELVDGKWLPAEEAAEARAKARAVEYAAKGYKEVDGVWVEPDNVEDAERGIFHHGGEIVSRADKLALLDGKVRHPLTGQLIDGDKLDKAKEGYFPTRGNEWVDRAAADKFHSDISHPWVVRTTYATILSTLPLEKIDELKMHADLGHEKVAPLFGSRQVSPEKRPVVIIARTQSEYRDYGSRWGDGTDVAGAFLVANEVEFELPGRGRVRPAVCENHKDWGTRYIMHAAAIGYLNAIAEEAGADLPLWFVHGVGSYASRFYTDHDAAWFGKQHIAKGGVGNIKAFVNSFALEGSLEATQIAYNLFQAGLLLSYAAHGGDQDATDAMLAVTEALSGKGKKSAAKAVAALEKVLIKSEDGIKAYLDKLIAKAQ